MQYNPEKIGKTIRSEREKNNLSQSELGKKINVSGKQISNYETGKLIPPIDILFELCNVFNCELGYLLGEKSYTYGTKENTIILNKTGLSIEALNAIMKITGTDKSCLEFGYDAQKYRELLNRILTSEKFQEIIEDMSELNYLYSAYKNNIDSKLITKIGKENLDKLMEKYSSLTLYDDQEDCENLIKIDQAIDCKLICQERTAFLRYKLQEKFILLLNELYPD